MRALSATSQRLRVVRKYWDLYVLPVLDKDPTTGQNCYQEDIPSMFPWWPKKAARKPEEVREAYLRRMREVLEDCTMPRCTSRASQITPSETTQAGVVELTTGALHN